MSEQVLVIPRRHIPDFDGLNYEWVHPGKISVKPQRHSILARMMDRDKAEQDPTFKQVIPYVLIIHPSLNQVCVYQRTKLAGEKRLHGKHSIGFGGHINTEETLEDAAKRELKEETGLELEVVPIAWLNDDSTEVGLVHLGLVYIAKLRDINLIKPSDDVDLKAWYTLEELKMGIAAYEDWSQLCIRFLPKILTRFKAYSHAIVHNVSEEVAEDIRSGYVNEEG